MQSKAQVVDIKRNKVSCEACIVSHKCLGYDTEKGVSCLFGGNMGDHQLLHRGEYLYRAGEPFQALYMIRSGVIKTYFISEDGEEQILGFHLPGEIIGYDGIAESEFPSNATALDTSSICRLGIDGMEKHYSRSPQLQNALLKGMSREILRHENMLMLLGKKKADQRLASFLLSRSTYQSRHGYSATVFTLAMTRTDIGKYLGLTVETVSRVLSRLQAQEVIAVHTNQIQILDLDALRCLAGDHIGKNPSTPHAGRPANHEPGTPPQGKSVRLS
jgi:CRP/FNR family transcriptional regulator